MAKQVKHRRGTTAQVAAMTPAEGEIVIDTTKDTACVGDGATAGGIELAKADGTPIGQNTPAAGTFTTFASQRITDNGAIVSLSTNLEFSGANPKILSNDLDGGMQISGGGNNTGLNMLLYGPTHLSNAYDWLMRADSNTIFSYDHSADLFNIPSDDLVVGGTTAGAASAVTLYANGDIDAGGSVSVTDFLRIPSKGELTIASGVITVTGSDHGIDTESNTSSDDLDTINGGTSGDILYLTAWSPARTVVLKDGTGNLSLDGDFSMDNNADVIVLKYTGSIWLEVTRSNNGA